MNGDEKLSNGARLMIASWIAGIVLALLKANRIIDWPWAIVTAPFWGPFAVFFLLLLFAAITMALARFFEWISKKL